MNEISQKNRQKFLNLKKFDLPLGQYAITGSGPMGVRNLREIVDVDIIVNAELWNDLATKYGIIDTGQIKKIVLPGEQIEVLGEDSFYTVKKDSDAPTVSDRIAKAELLKDCHLNLWNMFCTINEKWGEKRI